MMRVSSSRFFVYGPGGSPGSVLIGLLWCLALLSVVVIGVLHTSRVDLMLVKNYGDRIQAHYLAVAGIEKAKALLYHEARERSRSGNSHAGTLFNAPNEFRAVSLGRGQFQVIRRGRQDEGGGLLYGVDDEESRLNVNSAAAEQFARLELMTPDVIAAILDWRDEDNTVTPGGAEAEYYTSLMPPYKPRNGPFQTVRELLMVRGITPELLLGSDVHHNSGLGTLGDSAENATASSYTPGWAEFLTVHSLVNNVSAAGTDRINIQTADASTLTSVKGITPEIAKAIVAYRVQNRFNSVADLLDVTAPNNRPGGNPNDLAAQSQGAPPQGAPVPVSSPSPPAVAVSPPTVVEGGGPQPGAPGQSPGRGGPASPGGPRVISSTLLMDIADDLTAQSESDLTGMINVNTAGLEVLICLPGVDRELAQSIISFRQSNGFFPNIAWLLKVPGMTEALFKQLASLVVVRSETFRILSEGRISSTGVRQRIQEVVHIGLNELTTVGYREDDL